jgi:hypothetical protein
MNKTPSNEDRADNARRALYAGRFAGSEEENFVDLLTDLMHLCGREGYGFERLLGTAQMHYEEESQEIK